MLIAFIITWIIAAALTAKADAMLVGEPTDWLFNFPAGLFIWPVVAVLICCDKHRIYGYSHEYHN